MGKKGDVRAEGMSSISSAQLPVAEERSVRFGHDRMVVLESERSPNVANAARVMFTSSIALPFHPYSPRPSSPFTHPQLLTFPSTISRPPFSCPPLLILASPLRSARRSTHWYRPRTTPNPSSVPCSSSELNQTDISSAVSFSHSADRRTHVAALDWFKFRLTRCTCDAGLGLLLGVLVSLKQG